MRLGSFLLSIAIAFMVSCNGAAARTQSDPAALSPFAATHRLQSTVVANNGASQRFLRTEGVKVGDEERGMLDKLPSAHVAKLVRKDSLRKSTFEDWAKADIDLASLKTALKFKKSRIKWIQELKNANKKKLLQQYKEFLAGP